MKINIKITRRELATRAYGEATIIITGAATQLPDEARRIAEAITKIIKN